MRKFSVSLAFAVWLLFSAQQAQAEPLWKMEKELTVTALSVAEDGESIAVGTQDASMFVIGRDGTKKFEFAANNVVTGVSMINDGQTLVSSDDRHVYKLDADGKPIWSKDFKKTVKSVSAASDGSVAAITLFRSNAVDLLDKQGEIVKEIPVGIDIKSMQVSADGMWLVVGAADQYVYVFKRDGTLQAKIPVDGEIIGVAVAEDGSAVVGTSTNKVLIYDADGSKRGELTAKDTLTSVHVTNDGKYIAAADYSGNYYVASSEGRELWSTKETGAGQQVRFSRDGRRLYAASDKGSVFHYDVSGSVESSKKAAFVNRMIQAGGAVIVLGLAVLLMIWTLRKKQHIVQRLWKDKIAYLMLVPSFSLIFIFLYYPSFSGLFHSLYDWKPAARSEFVGMANFRRMLGDPYVSKGGSNLLILIVTGLFKTIVPPLLVAELIYHLRSKRAQYLFRTSFVISMVIPAVGMLLVWQDLFDPNIGMVNQLLHALGLGSLSRLWLGDPNTALWAIILMGFPFVGILQLLVMYSGLIAIPEEVIEASRIDGARTFRIIRSIHIPLLAGQFKLLIVLTLIGVVQDFGSILILTGGGPADSTYVPALQMYYAATKFNDLGYASALGVSMFFVIMLITIVNMKFIKTSTD